MPHSWSCSLDVQGDSRQRAAAAAGFASAARVLVGVPCGGVIGSKAVPTACVQVLVSTLSLQPSVACEAVVLFLFKTGLTAAWDRSLILVVRLSGRRKNRGAAKGHPEPEVDSRLLVTRLLSFCGPAHMCRAGEVISHLSWCLDKHVSRKDVWTTTTRTSTTTTQAQTGL